MKIKEANENDQVIQYRVIYKCKSVPKNVYFGKIKTYVYNSSKMNKDILDLDEGYQILKDKVMICGCVIYSSIYPYTEFYLVGRKDKISGKIFMNWDGYEAEPYAYLSSEMKKNHNKVYLGMLLNNQVVYFVENKKKLQNAINSYLFDDSKRKYLRRVK